MVAKGGVSGTEDVAPRVLLCEHQKMDLCMHQKVLSPAKDLVDLSKGILAPTF